MRRALILLAHGSSDPSWSTPISLIAKNIQNLKLTWKVQCAYLEIMSPNLEAAIQDLHNQGIRFIHVLPLFLGMGKHARQDIPLMVQVLKLQYPDLLLKLEPAIGENIEILMSISRTITKSLGDA